MINVLMCVFKSGDVIELTLEQLIDCPYVSKILIADGPHKGDIKPGPFIEIPSVKEIVNKFNSNKIYYKYSDYHENRARKNNEILKNVSKDCSWILGVDSDEVYHEDDLNKLYIFLQKSIYDRYYIHTVDFYPDFFHQIIIKDFKPRLYRYFKDCKCPDNDRKHQYVFSEKHKTNKEMHGMEKIPRKICQIYHLNALRKNDGELRRITKKDENTVVWNGGGRKIESKIFSFDIKNAPKSIRKINGFN